MKTLIQTLVVMTLPLILPGKVHASETNRTALEQANHDLAVYCMDILENRPDLASSHRINILREECYSENFTEHSPSIKDGREALLSVFEKRYKKYPELSMSIKRTVVEGDLVWIHLHVKHRIDSLGAAGIHIFRIKDGRIVEHWGVNQPVPETSKNTNTMF